MIRLQCACGKAFRIPDEFRGRQGRCPACAAIIIVPLADEMDNRLSAEFKARMYLQGGGPV